MRELWDGATYREERYAAMALTRHRHYRALPGPGHARPLPAPGRLRRVVGPRRLAGQPQRRRPAGGAPGRGHPGAARLGRRRRPVAAAHGDASASCTARTSTDVDLLRDALEANLEDSRHGREFFVRKARRLGAAAARPRRPGLGAGVRRRARGPAVRPVETRGSQAPVRVGRVWRRCRASGRGLRARSGKAEVRERSGLRRAPTTQPVGMRGRGRRGSLERHDLGFLGGRVPSDLWRDLPSLVVARER